jgi:hypothetical protein
MQHPEHHSVQSHREGILLCTEAQKDALAARLFFFLARSITNALGHHRDSKKFEF